MLGWHPQGLCHLLLPYGELDDCCTLFATGLWLDITLQPKLCIPRTLKCFCRFIPYKLNGIKTFWLPHKNALSFLLLLMSSLQQN
uniref:Uncharacterized protein n=1 Tax=Castor canadensis TaxID=51338 RepID=A0A8C0ZM08_CASCN